MVGPVLYHEMLLGARRNRGYVFRWCYGGWVLLQLAFFLLIAFINSSSRKGSVATGLDYVSFSEFANGFLVILVWQHYIVLLLATPVLTAGAVTDEKWRGTLQYLLVTELFSWEILLGKLIARLYQALLIAIVPLPVICFLGVFGGLDLFMLLTLAVSSVVMAFALGSMSLLASVLCRHTRDAVLGLYTVVALILVAANVARYVLDLLFAGKGTLWLGWFDKLLECFDPLHPMGTGWSLDDPEERLRRLGVSVLAWGVLGLVCLALAALRLRASYLRYLEHVAGRRWWPVLLVVNAFWIAAGLVAFVAWLAVRGVLLDTLDGTGPTPFGLALLRFLAVWVLVAAVLEAIVVGTLIGTRKSAAVLDGLHHLLDSNWLTRRARIKGDPLRWKERNVEGVAPLALLRATPRWLGVTLIFLATCVSCVWILARHLPPGETPGTVARKLLTLDFNTVASIHATMPRSDNAFFYQGLLVMMLAGLVIGIRCSGAVTGEREKNTWEALLLTPLETRQLVRSKLWGIIGASLPYLAAYALPALSFALIGGTGPIFWTVLWLGITLLAMAFVGAAGLWCSVRSKSSWRSLLTTLGISYLGGFVLFCVLSPFMFILALILLIFLMMFENMTGMRTTRSMFDLLNIFFLGICITLALVFAFSAWMFIRSAEYRVAILERTKHWRDEPRHPRWSRYGREQRRMAREDY